MTCIRSARPNRARPSGRGFSLIELIAVIVIIAIMGAVAIGASGRTYQNRQRAAARQLAGDLQYIRERAQTTGRSTWAAFAPASHTVTYTETVSGVPVAITDPVARGSFVTRFHTASEGQVYYGVRIGTINGSSSDVTIGFDFLGRPLTGAGALQTTNQVITITATVGSLTFSDVSVTIHAETGMIALSMP